MAGQMVIVIAYHSWHMQCLWDDEQAKAMLPAYPMSCAFVYNFKGIR